jgi:hypothetical protein
MLRQPGQPLFAVYFSVTFSKWPAVHWLMARPDGGGLEFVDYQTDKFGVAGSKPTVSPKPVLGILASDYTEEDLGYMKTLAICFWPGVKGPVQLVTQ